MKRIVIIGASSGIGRELTLQYAAEGHLVGITGRRSEFLQEIKSLYPQQVFIACFDVTGNENEKKFFGLIDALGGMDLLVYNAGFGEPSKVLDVKTELATTQVNVNGCVEMVGLAFNYFLQKGSGQIAITSSVAALRGNSFASLQRQQSLCQQLRRRIEPQSQAAQEKHRDHRHQAWFCGHQAGKRK